MLVESAIDALPPWLAEANLERIVCVYDSDTPAHLAAQSLKADRRIVVLNRMAPRTGTICFASSHPDTDH